MTQKSYPTIIGQIFFPNNLPSFIIPYIKQASNSFNLRNYSLSLNTYQKAIQIWNDSQVQFTSAIQLYFQISKANVYMAMNDLQTALVLFFKSKKISQKLPYNNYDKSLPYFGIGQIFYQMRQFQLSARAFLKARQIRQSLLGIQHVSTATVYNNLACCFYLLERQTQAAGYIQISQVVLDTQLGSYHNRTMIAKNNMNKIIHGKSQFILPDKKLWQVFQQDIYSSKKIKGKK